MQRTPAAGGGPTRERAMRVPPLLVLSVVLTATSASPSSPASARPQPMQSLLDSIHSISSGALGGSTPQVSFVNQPDGSIGFCLQGSPRASDSHDEYCMTANSSGLGWSTAHRVRSAPLPPGGTIYSAPPSLQWNGKHGAAAAASVLYAYYPLGTYSAGPAAWNGTSFVWEPQTAAEMRQVWSGQNGGGIHGCIRLSQGQYAGRILTQWQWDHHGILYMYSDDGCSWTNSTNRAVVEGDALGGVEPSSVELSNGTVLTFIRTMRTPDQATLWQAHSTDGGTSFAGAPHSTELISYQSPVLVLRVSGGVVAATSGVRAAPPPIVLVFNNARPTATSTSGETYRAILHAAISLDDGNTWQGFREVMRDSAMRGSADDNNDHGTAYPEGAATSDGFIVFLSGQGAQHWSAMRFGAAWLMETTQSANWTTPEAAAAWNDVSNFGGSYSSGCTAGTGVHLLGKGRVIACATCTGDEFDPQMHRPAFFQPDVTSSTIKIFAANVMPKCEEITCPSPSASNGSKPIRFNPCTYAHDNEGSPAGFERLQRANWGNRSGYTAWAADPRNWFNCSQLSVDVRVPCIQHDGVAVRAPRPQLTAAGLPHPQAQAPPGLALCAAMDAQARSAGFSWNFPSSIIGTLRLSVLIERVGFLGAQISLSDHWEPPWHDRHDPTVSIFVLDIPLGGIGGRVGLGAKGQFFDLTLTWDVAARQASWGVGVAGAEVSGGSMNVTRTSNMTTGAGGVNYVTVKALGSGGVCVATAHKEDGK